MRLLSAFVLAFSLALLAPIASGDAGIRCGMTNGSWGCSAAPATAPSGKNAIPGVDRQGDEPPEYQSPPETLTAPTGTEQAAPPPGGCTGGMVGTPDGCRCPPNSELLGGHCVHYKATCKSALAADAPVQACPRPEEKLSCKSRADGLKDCCCLTYEQ